MLQALTRIFLNCNSDDLKIAFKLRLVNRTIGNHIDQIIHRINIITSVTYNCYLYLQFDDTIYDSQCYSRKIAARYLVKNWKSYHDQRIPMILFDEIDLDDMILPQYSIGSRAFPDEYYIILHVLRKYPSIIVELYSIDMLCDLIDSQKKQLERKILNMIDDSDLNNIITFIPIVVVSSGQQIHALCYCNVVDTLLEKDFPQDSDRFLIISIEKSVDWNTKLTEYLQIFSDNIASSVETKFLPQNIATELSSFGNLFIRLIHLHNS